MKKPTRNLPGQQNPKNKTKTSFYLRVQTNFGIHICKSGKLQAFCITSDARTKKQTGMCNMPKNSWWLMKWQRTGKQKMNKTLSTKLSLRVLSARFFYKHTWQRKWWYWQDTLARNPTWSCIIWQRWNLNVTFTL